MSEYKEEPYTDFSAESPSNPERKCLWVICIDTSLSMTPHIKQLNQSLIDFKEAVSSDPIAADKIEVALVQFSDKVRVLCAPKLIDDLNLPELVPENATYLVEAVDRSIQVLDNRVEWYKSTNQSFYQPFIVLITDGEPNGPGDINVLSQTIKDRVNHSDPKKRFFFLSFGVDGADMNVLKQICVEDKDARFVKDGDFAALFEFLSTSMKSVGNSTDDADGIMKQIAASADDNDAFQQPI